MWSDPCPATDLKHYCQERAPLPQAQKAKGGVRMDVDEVEDEFEDNDEDEGEKHGQE